MIMFCQVKHSTACETQTRPDCKTIQWQACRYVLYCIYSGTHKPMEKEDDINEILASA